MPPARPVLRLLDFLLYLGKLGWLYATSKFILEGSLRPVYNNYSAVSYPVNEMLKDFYCAYHNRELVIKFCQCYECLLPVCSTCLDLHKEEHSLNQS